MTLKERQINGLMLFLALAVVMYAAGSAWFRNRPPDVNLPWGNIRSGPVVIEITGETGPSGVYYLPERTTFLQFLNMAGVEYSNPIGPNLFHPLKTGTTMRIHDSGQVTQEKMKSATRLALNMPIDINQATFEDLLLIPGIGESTARQILDLRQSSGGRISDLESLMDIKGIKEKRFEQLKGYFYIG
ncbi:MAG: helix-hairpin-helix domain-containing protein [Syntrophales bacterium]|jgi:competence protein ComEA|nr:helix-hairpin-helix domain-containing protein [Syntrophales bacterium]MCK9390735.1 helix-hairpin-helix domain-containing protein [Syntrophales bacterium]